jgi:hypothetical protein
MHASTYWVRPRGSQNKTTQTFRDLLSQAASEVGDSQEVGKDGEGGILAYLKVLAILERKTFAMLMGRILPLKITTEVKQTKETMTIEEAVADLKACGMEPLLAFYLKRYPLERDDEDCEWAKLIDTTIDTTLVDGAPVNMTPKESDAENDTEK